jgi:hypothetical protein
MDLIPSRSLLFSVKPTRVIKSQELSATFDLQSRASRETCAIFTRQLPITCGSADAENSTTRATAGGYTQRAEIWYHEAYDHVKCSLAR